jgi:glycosyltransferase involved in cell wall biosynthesis
MRALVLTVVHNPADTRIRHREINALLDAGWLVTYGAPFRACDAPSQSSHPALTLVDLPRAVGHRRLAAWRAARAVLTAQAHLHDVVLIHDLELLTTLPGLELPPVVWDVHEDAAASMSTKPWLPRVVRPLARTCARLAEHIAERRVHLLLAEPAYLDRFKTAHPVIRNTAHVPDVVPPPGADRVVYVGHLSIARGVGDMIEVARALSGKTDGGVRVQLIGHADQAAAAALAVAAEEGILSWAGFLSPDVAIQRVAGALAGLSLLHDLPNYRHSTPTKIIEYMARGVPVITTPLPIARQVVEEAGCGVVVPFGDSMATVEAILELRRDSQLRRRLGSAGHRAAVERFDWTVDAQAFVAEMTRVAGGSGRIDHARLTPSSDKTH